MQYQDYYPYGMLMPGRQGGTPTYRHGFNGMERDDEMKGGGNSLDFGARMYASRLGRFLSLDPAASEYPSLSDYAFVANNPIILIDPDGKRIVWAKDYRTKALKRAILKLTYKNSLFAKIYDVSVESRYDIYVSAGQDAIDFIKSREAKGPEGSDIRGTVSGTKVYFDNYNDRTIYEEFFHSAQNLIEYGEYVSSNGTYSSNNPVSKEAEVRLFLYMMDPDFLSSEEKQLVENIGKDVIKDMRKSIRKSGKIIVNDAISEGYSQYVDDFGEYYEKTYGKSHPYAGRGKGSGSLPTTTTELLQPSFSNPGSGLAVEESIESQEFSGSQESSSEE